jgi:branched-chain amino acid transport system permease protein
LVRAFFNRTLLGKALLACSFNRDAAQLVGIDVRVMLRLAYALSAALGALAGILIAPITFTSYEAGVMLGLKGFSAAIVGGIGNPMGAVAGGLLLGVLESLGAGFISSGYKDAIAFLFVLMVLFFEPTGLFGHKSRNGSESMRLVGFSALRGGGCAAALAVSRTTTSSPWSAYPPVCTSFSRWVSTC